VKSGQCDRQTERHCLVDWHALIGITLYSERNHHFGANNRCPIAAPAASKKSASASLIAVRLIWVRLNTERFLIARFEQL